MINKNFDKIKRLKRLKVSKNLKNGLKMKKRSAFEYLAIGIGVCAVLLFAAIYFYTQHWEHFLQYRKTHL